MKCNPATLVLGLSVLGASLPLFADDGAVKVVEIVHTERVSFFPGGAIRFQDSFGDLNVEGWDRPEVEITVTRSRSHFYEPQQQEQAARLLETVRVVAERRSDTDLSISTIVPSRAFFQNLEHKLAYFKHPLGGQGGVMLQYDVHVPRASRLAIHHRGGYVLVAEVTGDIEATSHQGDIVVMLPEPGPYAIDAKSRLGNVSSDFSGAFHNRLLVGERYSSPGPTPARRIYLRAGAGAVTIKAVPAK